jgi:hypothetical protein
LDEIEGYYLNILVYCRGLLICFYPWGHKSDGTSIISFVCFVNQQQCWILLLIISISYVQCSLSRKISRFKLAVRFINIRVKYFFASRGLTILFLVPCGSFRIIDGTLFMAKDGDGISVQLRQKLMEFHVICLKKLTCVPMHN